MRTSILSPAGRQPVRIATMMAIGASKPSAADALIAAGKSTTRAIAKALTWRNAATAAASVASAAAFVMMASCETPGTPELAAMSSAIVTAAVAMYPTFMQKGGRK